MSKFVDKLQSIFKSSTIPIGFRSSIAELKQPTMLVVAELSGTKLDGTKMIANVNASAGLICGDDLNSKMVGQIVKALDDIPLGVFVRGTGEAEVDRLANLGCDFIAFDIITSTSVLQAENIGKFLVLEPSLDQGYVRSINSLDIDGVFINNLNEKSFVAIEHLLVYRRFVEILEKPVMINLPSLITKAELTVLWQAGIVGVVSSPGQSMKTLKELDKMISKLPAKAKGRRTKADVKLPHCGGSVSEEEEEDQEEI